MTGTRNSSKSELFLIELIVAIVFFAISSAICAQLFVKAHTLSAKSGDLNAAVIQAQNAAESFKASGGSAEKLEGILQPSRVEKTGDGEYIYDLFFASGWKRTESMEDASYCLRLRLTSERELQTADIQVYTGERPLGGRPAGEQIYHVTAKSYNG